MPAVLTDTVVVQAPNRRRWDYGGYPYGLEPLTLPPRPALAGGPGADLSDLWRARDHLREILTAQPPATDVTADQLFWFRWITGHQVTFILWQLLARELDLAARTADPAAREAALRRAGVYVHGYSGMLLYTASCPRELYRRVIRPSMYLQHPAFSGSWARDYGPVRLFLRGRVQMTPLSPAVSRTLARQALNVRIHDGIAAKLVPDAPSLLQTAAGAGRLANRGVHGVLYDNYFMTLRGPVEQHLVVAQLIRRLHALAWDLRGNGLYPDWASSAHEKPASLTGGTVLGCEAGLPRLLHEIAIAATEGA